MCAEVVAGIVAADNSDLWDIRKKVRCISLSIENEYEVGFRMQSMGDEELQVPP